MPGTDSAAAPFPTPPARKLGKFEASKMLVKQSWAILKADKEMMWFPVLSAIGSALVLVAFGAIYFFAVLKGDTATLIALFEGNSTALDGYLNGNGITEYVLIFLYYVVSSFVIFYFQACIYLMVSGRMHGNNLSFGNTIAAANSRFFKIFLWSLITATVGIILNIIESRAKIAGQIVAWVFGAAWAILTYFSLPALVIDNASVSGSFSMSASVIRKTWGETILINVGISLYFGLLFALGFLVFIVGLIIFPSTIVLVVLGILFLVYILAIAIISSTLSSIFKLALYEYAKTGTVPSGFSADLMNQAISKQ